MAAKLRFHTEALFEYAEATRFYLREASPRIASRFVDALEAAISSITAAPAQWRIVDDPEVRRYVLSRFPFVIYYGWEPTKEQVVIYAVMHTSRDPGYWRERA